MHRTFKALLCRDSCRSIFPAANVIKLQPSAAPRGSGGPIKSRLIRLERRCKLIRNRPPAQQPRLRSFRNCPEFFARGGVKPGFQLVAAMAAYGAHYLEHPRHKMGIAYSSPVSVFDLRQLFAANRLHAELTHQGRDMIVDKKGTGHRGRVHATSSSLEVFCTL